MLMCLYKTCMLSYQHFITEKSNKVLILGSQPLNTEDQEEAKRRGNLFS